MRICTKGQMLDDVIEMIVGNTRAAGDAMGDFLAQCEANAKAWNAALRKLTRLSSLRDLSLIACWRTNATGVRPLADLELDRLDLRGSPIRCWHEEGTPEE